MTKILENNINTPKYWNNVYESEIKQGKERIAMERFEKVAEMIPDGSVVVDVGCGMGEFVNYLHEKRNKCIISGIDFSKIAIDHAKKNTPSCSFFVDDVMKISNLFKDIDYIVSFETIEHLDEPEKFINEMYKILKKDGLLFLSTPYSTLVGSPEHIHSFNFSEMCNLFEVTDLWAPINLLRYSDKFKNMLIVAKKLK